MDFEGRVGYKTSNDGAKEIIRLGKTAEIMVSDANPRHYDSVINELVFTGANLLGTPVTTQAGLSATTPALTLYNPSNSGVNLVLLTVTLDITSSPAAATAFCLAFNALNATAPSATTASTVTSNILGETTSPKGQCYRIATLAAAPTAFRFIGGVTGASAISGVQLIDHIDGEYVIPPGVAVSIQSSAAAAIVASFSWKEIKI